MTDAEKLKALRLIFDQTLVKTGPDAGKRSGLHSSSVWEAIAILDGVAVDDPLTDSQRASVERIRQAASRKTGRLS